MVIELKCEGYFNALDFKDEMNKDIKKVTDGMFKDRLLCGGCNIYCIAFATSNQGGCDMEDLGIELFEMENLAVSFQLWWWVREIEDEEFHLSEEDEPEWAADEGDYEMKAYELNGYEDPSVLGYHSSGWNPHYSAYY